VGAASSRDFAIMGYRATCFRGWKPLPREIDALKLTTLTLITTDNLQRTTNNGQQTTYDGQQNSFDGHYRSKGSKLNHEFKKTYPDKK
jgi:hypothetical protein